MRTLSIAALIALLSMAGLTHAQGTPQRDPQAVANAIRQLQLGQERLREMREQRTTCALPDGSSHPLNAVVTYEGQSYRCVEVFLPTPTALVPRAKDQTLAVRLAGWVKAVV